MNPVFVELEDGRIYIKSDISDKDRCKSVPGTRWNKDRGQWHSPLSWASCKILRSTFGDRIQIGPALMEWAKNEVVGRIQPSVALRSLLELDKDHSVYAQLQEPGYIPQDLALYPFQAVDVAFMLAAQNCLLGTPMGGGKTIVSIVAARLTGEKNFLVVCPSSIRRTWKKEINIWWPGIPVHVVEGTAAKRAATLRAAKEHGGWVIVNWEAVRLHSRLAPYGSIALTDKEKEPKELNQIPFDVAVVDEAHKLKDPKSKQTRATWAVVQSPTVKYRWALSGTPLTNKPDTLFPILHALSKEEWPSKTAFVNRYCMSAINIWGGMEIFGLKPEMKAEFEDIFDPRFRRLPKEIILPQLPPIVMETRYVEMNPKQQKAYNSMVENLCSTMDDGSMVIASNPISQLTRLTQYASAYLEDTEEGPRMTDPSCKLDQLMEDLEDISEPVVVFAVSRQLIEMAEVRLEKAKISFSVVKGGQSNDQRQNAIDAFQEGRVDICLVVVAAGGVGVNLHRARIGIFLQRPWSNVDYQQAKGRIHRIGSEVHNSVLYIDYITNGTIEIGQIVVLEGKEESLQEIVRDADSIRKFMSGN